MPLKLHNSLTRKTEAIKPINPKQISLYTCGPTVYDHVHIGNLRTYVFEDTLRRVLRASGYKVKHVMNITDVDDKTIKRSRQDYPSDEPIEALKKLSAHYEEIFYSDAKKIGIDLANSKIVRATEHIADMQKLIKAIPNKYVSDDGIYYDIAQDHDYGILAKLDRSHQHHRINNDEYDKDHVADFALWKKQDQAEPAWDFELDGRQIAGRPGWHIECSAMSVKYLGQPFDIHTGGVDLIFPHHENEIAQVRAAHGKNLANYFVHSEHLLVDGHKMSKSLDNFYQLADIEAKDFEPLAVRLLFLQAHYRSQLNFTWKSLSAAQKYLKSLHAIADLRFQLNPNAALLGESFFDDQQSIILDFLQNDLATAQALSLVSSVSEKIEMQAQGVHPRHGQTFNLFLSFLDELFGLKLNQSSDISDQQKQLMADRETARQAKAWSKADQIRQTLLAGGIEINDTSHGPVWYRA